MYRQSASLILTLFSVVWSVPGDPVDWAYQNQQPEPKAKTVGGSLTRCVDAQEGRYVLVDDKTLAPIADLQANGFPRGGFAKHLGNKVTVRGTIDSSGARPFVKVRSIETVCNGLGGQKQVRGT